MAVTNMSITFNKLSIFAFCVYTIRSSSTYAIGEMKKMLTRKRTHTHTHIHTSHIHTQTHIYIYIYINAIHMTVFNIIKYILNIYIYIYKIHMYNTDHIIYICIYIYIYIYIYIRYEHSLFHGILISLLL